MLVISLVLIHNLKKQGNVYRLLRCNILAIAQFLCCIKAISILFSLSSYTDNDFLQFLLILVAVFYYWKNSDSLTIIQFLSGQNGPSSQRRRFNPQHQNIRLNGSLKPQGTTNEADQNNVKSGSRSEHRRQQHNNFRPKNKGAMKNQEQSATARTTENVAHPEKSRRKHHATDTTDHRPFRGGVGRVSQCNLCPARMEVSADTTVLSVPAVTLVA